MPFEETAPVGTDTTFHLHRDSDEVGEVLSGEITFKIDEEVTVGGRAPAPHAARRAACLKAHRRRNRPCAVPLSPAGAGGFFEERLGRPTGSINGEEANEIRRRYGWEIVGPPPF